MENGAKLCRGGSNDVRCLSLLGGSSLGSGLCLLHLSNDSVHLCHLSLRSDVCAQSLLGEPPRTLSGVVTATLEDLHDTLLIRSPTSNLTHNTTNKLSALAETLMNGLEDDGRGETDAAATVAWQQQNEDRRKWATKRQGRWKDDDT